MAYRKIFAVFDVNDRASSVLFDESLYMALRTGAELILFCCIEPGTVAEEEDRVATFAGPAGHLYPAQSGRQVDGQHLSSSFTDLDMSDAQRIHDQQRQVELQHIRAWLEALATVAANRGVTSRTQVEQGKPAHRICECAAQWGADLIVLGHSSRHPLRELLLGSINSHVIRCAPCAILLVKRT